MENGGSLKVTGGPTKLANFSRNFKTLSASLNFIPVLSHLLKTYNAWFIKTIIN